MSNFIEVDHERRTPRSGKGSTYNPKSMLGRLRDGATILVPLEKFSGGSSSVLKRQGYRLHIRTNPDGIVMWADKISQDNHQQTRIETE